MKLTSIPVQELVKVLSLVTLENCPPPDIDKDNLNYRRVWIFKIEDKIVLEFTYDDSSLQELINKYPSKESIKILGELELHWSSKLNDWYINMEHL